MKKKNPKKKNPKKTNLAIPVSIISERKNIMLKY